jgi:hypothetical protein
VADHPLRPATDHSLGKPLPYQLANRTRAHLKADCSFYLATYAVLANLSVSYPPLRGRFPRVTHPSATGYCYPVRLACVRHTASVRPEPGSNSPLPKSLVRLPLRVSSENLRTLVCLLKSFDRRRSWLFSYQGSSSAACATRVSNRIASFVLNQQIIQRLRVAYLRCKR